MRFHSFLIKYGEIGIKGKNRYLFEDALVRQIRFALKDVDGEFNVHKAGLSHAFLFRMQSPDRYGSPFYHCLPALLPPRMG